MTWLSRLLSGCLEHAYLRERNPETQELELACQHCGARQTVLAGQVLKVR